MRFVCSDPSHHDLKIFDEDGKEISLAGIRDIQISIPVQGVVTATIEVLAEVDIVGAANFKHKRITFDHAKGESREEVIAE